MKKKIIYFSFFKHFSFFNEELHSQKSIVVKKNRNSNSLENIIQSATSKNRK